MNKGQMGKLKTKIHFNRVNMQRGNPNIWTVHNSKGCFQGKKVTITNTTNRDLYECLKALVKCIRNFKLGDYSPLMDEIFDAEAALKEASKAKDVVFETVFNPSGKQPRAYLVSRAEINATSKAGHLKVEI